jgi:hypothetical protein
MFTSRFLIIVPALTTLLLGACASAPDQQAAARECKVAVADFPGKPKQDVTAAEKADARMKISRLAWERGGYASGNNVFADVMRDCY